LKWYYKSTGKDRTDQISITLEKADEKLKVTANVYNWDPEWKVEYFVDDQPMGALKNEIGYDPEAVRLYKGDKLPVGRTFPEPRLTDHIFTTHIGTAVRKIRFVATDRFGETFSRELSV